MEEHMILWRKGPWTAEEDRLLTEHVKLHGEGRWNSVTRLAGLKRNAKSCRLRWVNYLRPDLKRGKITPYEEKIILNLHAQWGNRWSTIARSLPGRTDNEIKNYWRTHFKKKGQMSSNDSAKLRARLLKRQKFQQEQHNQLQLQKNKEDMKNLLLLLEESNNKVVWRHQDMVHEEMSTVLYPIMFNDSQRVVETNSMYEDFVLWDGLWNLEDVPIATTKGLGEWCETEKLSPEPLFESSLPLFRPPLFEGRDVYILGAANVGKSAFINALLKWTLYEQVANAALDCQCLEVAKDNCDHLPLEIDEYELVDPVDILTPLEKLGFWNGMRLVNLEYSILT
ncbi:hypothetical protein L6452_29887 [Arctium lappa]|uniref:Uncharacterized protein n=1 Tax=Arctium lappa TaxID=4217 RepID=A0ACB8ZHM6_ARCLA|nr:hypothetical protein L6452_29887 [Arctium lappa]